MAAAQRGYVEICALLLERGASVNKMVLSGGTALLGAAWQGQTETYKFLLDNGAGVEIPSAPTGGTSGVRPLMVSAERGPAETCALLIDRGADVSAATSQGVTVLMIAAGAGQTKICTMLLEKGADINATSQKDHVTTLMIAAFSSCIIQRVASKGLGSGRGHISCQHALVLRWWHRCST
jgi:ankyrin repeat protein